MDLKFGVRVVVERRVTPPAAANGVSQTPNPGKRTANGEPRKGIHHRGTKGRSSGVQELQESEGRFDDSALQPRNPELRTPNSEREFTTEDSG
jgi:hypothetical protein